MAYKQMFFVQVFVVLTKNQLSAGRSYPVASEEEAVRKARLFSEKVAGVIAFSQMVDEAAGDAEEPVLLACHGRVPAEAQAAAA